METRQMQSECSDDFNLIENETFDFDLPVSPSECPPERLIDVTEAEEDDEDEDEVFLGPVGFKEQCVATKAELVIAERKSMSPPNPEQYAALFKEAWAIALELEQKSSKDSSSSSSSSATSLHSGGRSAGKASADESNSGSNSTFCETIREECTNSVSNCNNNTKQTTDKAELESFKREVKRELRCPVRRSTYTIATNQSSPYPTIESSPENGSVTQQNKAASKLLQPRPPQQPAPANGRVSRLPTRGLRKPQPISRGKATGIPNGISHSKNGSRPTNGCTESSGDEGCNPPTGIRKPTVKRLASPKRMLLRKPGFSRENGNKLSAPQPCNNTTATKSDKAPSLKAPAKKPSLVRPAVVNRQGLKSGGTAGGVSKLQPMKATMTFGAQPAATNIPAPSGVSKMASPQTKAVQRKPSTPRAATPCTPVCQEKKVIPKRILSNEVATPRTPAKAVATPRRSSIASIPRPSTPVRTPRTRQSSIPNPALSVGPPSARRRSSIPTPQRRASTGIKPRSSGTDSVSGSQVKPAVSRPQSALSAQNAGESLKPTSLFISPLKTPPQLQLSPDPPKDDEKTMKGLAEPLGSSPDCLVSNSKTPNPATVLQTRTNVPNPVKEFSSLKTTTPKAAPAVGLLIDFGSATPKDKKISKKVGQLEYTEEKENLISF